MRLRTGRFLRISTLGVAVVAVMGLVPAAATASSEAETTYTASAPTPDMITRSGGSGCDQSRRAVVHDGKGRRVGARSPRVPCATETGFYTGETTIGVTEQGTVWFSAADWEWALVRSRDEGRTWEKFFVPGPQAYPGCGIGVTFFTPCANSQQAKYNTVADAFLWVDPATSKIFWSKTYGYAMCSSMNMSPDDGRTWAPVTSFACPGGDYEKISGGPPPDGGEQPTGYPNVLYVCVNGPAPTFVVGPSRVCYKSLDAGRTWVTSGSPVTPSPQAAGCLHFQEPQQVAPDGTIYLPLGCFFDPQRIMVAKSSNEGLTWEYVQVPMRGVTNANDLFGGVSMAIDQGGTVYLSWADQEGRIRMSFTKDGGESWKGPLIVSMPGVVAGRPYAQIAARKPGHIAIAYYGHEKGKKASILNGYLTESFNASAGDPRFHSALLNDPNDPLYFPVKDNGTFPRNDYLGVTIAPDGTPWTALVKLRSPKPDREGFIQSTGFAARLTSRK